MLKPNIYIIVEHSNRELLSQIFFSIVAIKDNFRVYIGNYRGIFKLLSLKKKKSGIFLIKGGLSKKLTEFVKKKCEKYIILDQEISPGYKRKFYVNWVSNRFYKETIKFIDLYLCLNKDIYIASKKNLFFKKNKVKLLQTGWPRVDTWRPKLKKFYESEIKQIKKKYHNFILFSSDFGVTSREDFEEELQRIPWGTNKNEIEKIKKKNFIHATNALNEYKKFILLLKKLDKQENCPLILIRSHPGESLMGWSNDLKKLKNIKYIKPEGPIDPYIFACKGFVHRGSTTTYQAILLNKPIAFIYLDKHVKKIHLHKPSLMKNSTIIKNDKELINWFNFNLNKKLNKYNKKIFDELNFEEKFASQKIIEEFQTFNCKKDEGVSSFFKEVTIYEKIFFTFKNFLAKILRKKKSNFNSTKIYKINKGIKMQNIKSSIKKLNKIFKLTSLKKLKINQVSENVVEIENKF